MDSDDTLELSLAWCFLPAGAGFWAAVSCFRCVFWSRAGNVVSSSFGKVSDDTLGTFLVLLCGMVFPVRERCFRCVFWSRAGNVASSSFGRASDDTLGTFSALLCGFSVLHWHGVSPSGSRVLPCFGCRVSVCFLSRAGNVVSSSFGRVSDDTLGTFSVLFCSFSVLHWHGVCLSGSRVLGCRVSFSVCFLGPCWQRCF